MWVRKSKKKVSTTWFYYIYSDLICFVIYLYSHNPQNRFVQLLNHNLWSCKIRVFPEGASSWDVQCPPPPPPSPRRGCCLPAAQAACWPLGLWMTPPLAPPRRKLAPLRSFHSCSHSEHSSHLCQCAKRFTYNLPGWPRKHPNNLNVVLKIPSNIIISKERDICIWDINNEVSFSDSCRYANWL